MPLPNPGQSFTAFDPLTAAELNDTVENIEALADGSGLDNLAVTTAKIANNAVTDAKLAADIVSTLGGGWNTKNPSGATLPTPNTITYNGRRNYTLVFNSTNLTGYISNGMRLRATRTVTAPTQCTSLNGTTQYYSKASPNKLTFTNNFVVSAWVKVSSYATGIIASRYNGTSGWRLGLNSSGQVFLAGHNTGAGNQSAVQSYQSLPLNKWVHVAAQLDMFTFTATTTTSYVMLDGVDVPASVSRIGTNPTTLIQAGDLQIGAENGATNPFPGKIAQVAIYSAKVTQANIAATISQGLSGSETSLASAYSFNNSITDLNTTTPNDLTANGSAVATNVDSPFAGGASASTAYTAGTTEFGEVFNVSFSTNTTVVVQVPDGYAIPTSGGVSAVAYSVGERPLGWPGPITTLAIAMLLATFTSTTTGSFADITGLNITGYIPAGRKVRLTLGVYYASTSAAGGTFLEQAIADTTSGTTHLATSGMSAAAASYAQSPAVAIEHTPPASGSRTYKAQFKTNAAGTYTLAASTTAPITLKLELV